MLFVSKKDRCLLSLTALLSSPWSQESTLKIERCGIHFLLAYFQGSFLDSFSEKLWKLSIISHILKNLLRTSISEYQ